MLTVSTVNLMSRGKQERETERERQRERDRERDRERERVQSTVDGDCSNTNIPDSTALHRQISSVP